MVSIKQATEDDFDLVCDITTRAFDDDPVVSWMLRKDHRRPEAFRLFFRILARTIYFPSGEVYVNDSGAGATMWLPPGVTYNPGFIDQLRTIPDMIRISGWRGIPRLLRLGPLLNGKRPEKPHYYLFTIAALPEMRGQGIGSGLMEPMTRRFDEQRALAWLENSREANLPFYIRHGFEVMEQIQLPDDGPPMWLMCREPQAVTQSRQELS